MVFACFSLILHVCEIFGSHLRETILTLSVSKNHPCEVVLHSVIHYSESNLRENNSVHNGILVRQNVALSFKMMFTNNNDYIRKHLY